MTDSITHWVEQIRQTCQKMFASKQNDPLSAFWYNFGMLLIAMFDILWFISEIGFGFS